MQGPTPLLASVQVPPHHPPNSLTVDVDAVGQAQAAGEGAEAALHAQGAFLLRPAARLAAALAADGQHTVGRHLGEELEQEGGRGKW